MTHPKPDLVSSEELGRWLGLSGKEVYDLGKAGVLVRVGRAYRLEDSVRTLVPEAEIFRPRPRHDR